MHGGNIYETNISHDFSVNLNPLGIPNGVLKTLSEGLEVLNNYPDMECRELCRQLLETYKMEGVVLSESSVAFGNGASELIPAVLRGNKTKKVMLVAPCFTGYSKAVSSVEAEISYFYLSEKEDFELGLTQAEALINQLEKDKPDTLILTNPNNPNGKLIEPSVLLKIKEACRQNNVLLLIDECFMTLTGKNQTHSIISNLYEDEKTVVLRAFTKTFAIPGIRLGYCVCKNQALMNAIKNQLPEWNVSGLAQIAGIQALKEMEYVSKACEIIQNQKVEMCKKLKAFGFEVYDSDVNYILFKTHQLNLHEKLLEKHILIRDCSDYEGLGKGYIRVAVKLPEENEILIAAIKGIING